MASLFWLCSAKVSKKHIEDEQCLRLQLQLFGIEISKALRDQCYLLNILQMRPQFSMKPAISRLQLKNFEVSTLY